MTGFLRALDFVAWLVIFAWWCCLATRLQLWERKKKQCK